MPTLTPTTHDWTHEPGGYRIVLVPMHNGTDGYIEERDEDGTIDSYLVTWGPGDPAPIMRAKVKAWFDGGLIDEETASMLLAQLADHD